MIDGGHVVAAGFLAGLLLLAVPAEAQVTFRAAASAGVAASSTITFRSAAEAASGSLTLTINRPTGTVQDDVMIATIGFRPNTATITPPSGWTLVRRTDNAGGTPSSLAVYRKVAGSSEPSNYSWSFSTSAGSAGGIMTFAGVDTGSPVNADNGQNTPASLTHSTPSITTSDANTMLVASFSFGSSATWTTGSGMTEAVDVMSQGQGCCGQSLAAYYIAQGAAGGTGAKTATASNDSDSGNAHLLALQRGGASLTVNKPTGTIQNDVMIASVAVRPHTVTITPPAGWTLVRRMDNANATANALAVYRKLAAASEPASYTWTLSTHTGATAGIQSFAGVDTTTPIDVENGQNTPNGTSHATPTVSTTMANTMLVTSHGISNPGPNHWTPPTGMTEAFDDYGGMEAIGGNYVVQAAAGPTGAKSAASAVSDVGNAHILALRPYDTCAAVPDVAYVAAAAPSGTGSVTVYWSNANSPLILRKTTPFAGEAPANGQSYTAGNSIGTALVAHDGSAGIAGMTCTAGTCTNTGLSNATTYYFKIFAKNGTCYAAGTGAEVNATPQAGPRPAWSYTLAGGPMLKAGIAGEGTVHTTSNAKYILSLNTADGTQTWAPVATNEAVQSWLTWLPTQGGIKSVQSGTATLTTQASLSVPISPVTLARSILFFSVREDNFEPTNGHVRGRLTSGTNIQFNREGTATTTTIEWYVAEFLGGVSVQHGSTNVTAAPMNVAISPVNLGKTFVLASWQKPGSTYGNDDVLRARLTSPTNLELTHDTAGSTLDGTADWQVVSMANASVQRGDLSFLSTDASLTVPVASVDTTKSFVVASWLSYGGAIGANFVRGRITSPTQLTFDRGTTGAALDLTWYLVTLTDGSSVQSGNASFGAAATQVDVSLSAVTLSRSVAFLSGNQRGGSTPYAGLSPNDNPGVGWFTADMTGTTNLRLTRSVTGSATAEAAWFVVSFAQGVEAPTVISGDQSGWVYSVDVGLGATVWTADLTASADFIQTTPAAQLRSFSNAAFQATYADDVIFVGSRNAGDTNCGAATTTTNNKIFALRASDGAVLWTFNGACTEQVDWIVGMPYVDYGRNRLYVTSRAGAAGTQTSLWVIDTLTGALVTPPAPLALGHMEASPTLSWDGNTIYAANWSGTTGTFYAVDATTLTVKWSLPLGAASVKGFVWEDPNSPGRLYASTGSSVLCGQDNGASGSACAGWTSPSIPGASTLLLLDNKIYVGSSDGTVHQIDPATGVDEKQFPAVGTLDGTQVGDVSTETGSELFVGTAAGKLYKLPLPLP
ncbi:MAG: PQQ-binding-like beta-propeller repeat protein [Candidatus Rokuibacteriota bacterium]